MIGQDTLFRNFRIESNNNNEIWLELHLDALLKVLRSADSSSESSLPRWSATCHRRFFPWTVSPTS